MDKIKKFQNLFFRQDTIEDACTQMLSILKKKNLKINSERYPTLRCSYSDSEWYFDIPEEFFAEYKPELDSSAFHYSISIGQNFESAIIRVNTTGQYSSISVEGPDRSFVEAIHNVFEKARLTSQLPELPKQKKTQPPINVFIGHGRSTDWRDLKDHLTDKHNIQVEAFETGARAGHHIRDVLNGMASKSNFALLVLTGEDETVEGNMRARQNVIHEAGLFQGRLGFDRAIILMEDGVEELSNLFGISQIRYPKGHIANTYGDVLATLKREFGSI